MTEQPMGWDEATRPTFPVPDGVSYTPRQRAAPQHLVEVHGALRAELEQLRVIVQEVVDGALQVGSARSAINRMSVRQHNWTLGAYCAQYCRIVTGHHGFEDRGVFPHLREVAGAAPVIDRLEVEHEVIAELLEHVDGALVALVSQGGVVDRCRTSSSDSRTLCSPICPTRSASSSIRWPNEGSSDDPPGIGELE